MAKETHFEHDLGHFGPNSGRQIFFNFLASSVTRYHGQLSSCKISEKKPILRKFSDGWTDGQTDHSNFTGCCPADVEHPIKRKPIITSCCRNISNK